jgi:hypothetical protein
VISDPQAAENPGEPGKIQGLWATCAVVVALVVWMAIIWVHFGRTVIGSYSPLPFYDYWDTVPQIDHYRQLDAGVLWRQHSEHRIVFPEITFATDYRFFQGREILPIALNILFYFSIWLLFSATLYRNKQLPMFARVCAILAGGIVMGWEGGAFSIAGPFLVQWSLLLAAAIIALFLLTRVPGSRRSWIYLAGAIACCIICSYTSANGLFFWAVILLAAWILRLTKSELSILAASAAISIGLYFVDYHFLAGTNFGAVLTRPFYALSFVGAYLGMPFTVAAPGFGICLGFLELAAYLVFILLAIKRRLLNSRTSVVLLGFYLFCLLTAAITAMGRMSPEDPAFTAATAHRYILVPLTAHAALILAAGWLLGNSRYYLWAGFVSVLLLSFGLTGKSRRIRDWSDLAKSSFSNCQLASLAFESGVDDPGMMGTVYPGGGPVKQALAILRKNHLSTFADGRMDWLGKPASTVFRFVSHDRQAGAVTASYPLESGLVVIGWTDLPRRIWHPQKLVFLDDQKRIIGFGRKPPGGLPRGLASYETPQSLAWLGYVNLGFQSKSFSAYTVEGRGRALVPLGKSAAIPPIRILHEDQVGALVPSLRWDVQASWIKNGPLPGTPVETPSTISYYESYAGSYANTGALTSAPLARPSGSCLVIASAHGPSVEGLSETVVDADTGEAIASAPQIGPDNKWSFWAVDLPPSAQRLQIVAEDHGRGWGQWLAVAEPHFCK